MALDLAQDQTALLNVEGLTTYFDITGGLMGGTTARVHAVEDISFHIKPGETLAMVGESGCGKSTTGRTLIGLEKATAGKVEFDGVDLTKMSRRDRKAAVTQMQMIFQDPYSSLNPRMTVRDIIAEPLVAMDLMQGSALEEQIRTTATRCRLSLEHLRRFPHAFSGGQRQRIGIARALVSNPQFIVCDESVSALDVSIQADILNLLIDLQDELNLTYLFIAHDLSVVAHISTRVAVMYVGQLVELAPTRKLFYTPKHPYTEALLSAIPEVDPDKNMNQIQLEGEIPNPADPPSGCRFHTRCPYVQDRCRIEVPEWTEIEAEHFVSCHFADELELKGAS